MLLRVEFGTSKLDFILFICRSKLVCILQRSSLRAASCFFNALLNFYSICASPDLEVMEETAVVVVLVVLTLPCKFSSVFAVQYFLLLNGMQRSGEDLECSREVSCIG